MFKFKCKLPSKKVVYCEEITNETYISLHKYVMNNDLLGFYKELDEHIAKTVPEIYSLDLLDKVYIYLSIRAYSISDAIELKTDNFFNKDLYSLFDTLDNLRETFFEPIETIIETKSGDAKFKINCPFLFEEIDDELLPDILSGVKNINLNSQEFCLETSKDLLALNYLITPENYNKLNDLILQKYNINIIFAKGKIELPLLSHLTYRFIAESLFFNDLDGLYTLSYSLLRHLNLSLSDFNKMSPIESTIFMSKLIKEKEEEREAEEKNNSNNKNEFIF